MKKVVLNSFIIATIALMAIVFTSCKSKKGSDLKLLETIEYADGRLTKFEYDNKNRVVKIFNFFKGELFETIKFTYKRDDLIKIDRTPNEDMRIPYEINENTITSGGPGWVCIMTVNSNGYITEKSDLEGPGSCETVFHYQGSNMTKQTMVCTHDYGNEDEKQEMKQTSNINTTIKSRRFITA